MSEKSFSLSAVGSHKSKTDLWLTIHGKVYNVTKYTEEHPGGLDSMMEVAGTDATSVFEDVGHSADARETMAQFFIGKLEGASEQQENPRPAPVIPVQQKHQATPAKSSTQTTSTAFMLLAGGVITLAIGVGLIRAVEPSSSHMKFGGFWSGCLIATVPLGLISVVSLVRLERAMNAYPDFRSFPAHVKVNNAVVEITPNKGVLNPAEYQKFPLVRKVNISHNVVNLVFALPSSNSILGLPIGQHVAIRANVNGKSVSRSYTPVSNNSDQGELRLAIKIYPDGQLTGGYLANLKPGDEVEFRGPKGAMRYRKGRFNHIGMIAGGTGITPMFQVIRAICEDKTDTTEVSLVFANGTEDDILLRTQLETFQRDYPKNLKLWYMLDNPPQKGWAYGKGYVTKEVLEQRMPHMAPDTQILLCGPPGMVKACKSNLENMGFPKASAVSKATDQLFLF